MVVYWLLCRDTRAVYRERGWREEKKSLFLFREEEEETSGCCLGLWWTNNNRRRIESVEEEVGGVPVETFLCARSRRLRLLEVVTRMLCPQLFCFFSSCV